MTISVTQLNNYVKGIFDMDAVLSDLSVCGEITNVKRSYNGWYFTLKDNDAAVNCFCYANSSEPVIGMVAVAEGELNYFAKSGSVSFFVRRLAATTDTGAAYLRFVELKEKLGKEGLFDEQRKKPVPHSASKIGVVTSETGAVIHDITNVALRRQPFSDIILYPVKVQGVGADKEIAQGIAYFDKSDVDAVIVGRGGGSNEDLSAFNSEIVVRAIAACSKPIVSAVGHGIDFTLSDFAADKRAVTPSEAAEFVTLDSEREKMRVAMCLERINGGVVSLLESRRQRVLNSCRLLYFGVGRKLDEMQNAVKSDLVRVENATVSLSEKLSSKLEKVTEKLRSINPTNVLQRGYGYVHGPKGAVKSVRQIDVGDSVTVTLSDGKFCARVTQKENKQ